MTTTTATPGQDTARDDGEEVLPGFGLDEFEVRRWRFGRRQPDRQGPGA